MHAYMLNEGYVTPKSDLGRTYTLHEELGSGGYATVFRTVGLYDLDEDPVSLAIKFPESPGQGAATALQREARMMNASGCGNVVEVIDHSYDPEHPYLVLEYVPETLHKLLASERMTQLIFKNLIGQTPNLLEMILRNDVAHLDLKPDNIGYGSNQPGAPVDLTNYGDNFVVALDFGLAREIALGFQDEHDGNPHDNPQYPPEFFERGELNETTDTHIMGRVLGWVLSGTDVNSVGQLVTKTRARHQINVPPSLVKMYSAMTNENPHKRPNPIELRSYADAVLEDLKDPLFYQNGFWDRVRPLSLQFSGSRTALPHTADISLVKKGTLVSLGSLLG